MNTDQTTPQVVLRPPFILILALASGLGLEALSPTWMPEGAWPKWLGTGLFLAGILSVGAGFFALRRAGTPVPTWRPTATVVTGGIYRFTRNPIYLGFALVVFGVGCWKSSAWVLMAGLVMVAVLHFGVIRREEAYLAQRFGDVYMRYLGKVRRWL